MKTFSLLLVLLFLVISCNKDVLTKENFMKPDETVLLKNCINNFNNYNAGDLKSGAIMKSNKNLVKRTITFHPSSGIFYVQLSPDACSDFNPPLQFVIEGGGTATHLGEYTVANLSCVDPLGNFLSPVYGFITAANGDEIHTMMMNAYPDLDNPPYFYYEYTILGGTGRFKAAQGSLLTYGITDFATGTWELSGSGEIWY